MIRYFNTFLSFLFLTFNCFLHAQNDIKSIEVKYNFNLTWKDLGSEFSYDSKLVMNDSLSLFEIIYEEIERKEKGEESEKILSIDGDNSYVFKSKESMYSEENILFKDFYIKDTLLDFNWKLENETKSILGFNCQKATTTFRGRDYQAWFTTNTPFTGGPWKFHGLPGLILEVSSIDGVLFIEANSVEYSENNTIIENPYQKEKLMNWSDFKQLYTKKYHEHNKITYGADGSSSQSKIPKGGIEIYVEEE